MPLARPRAETKAQDTRRDSSWLIQQHQSARTPVDEPSSAIQAEAIASRCSSKLAINLRSCETALLELRRPALTTDQPQKSGVRAPARRQPFSFSDQQPDSNSDQPGKQIR